MFTCTSTTRPQASVLAASAQTNRSRTHRRPAASTRPRQIAFLVKRELCALARTHVKNRDAVRARQRHHDLVVVLGDDTVLGELCRAQDRRVRLLPDLDPCGGLFEANPESGRDLVGDNAAGSACRSREQENGARQSENAERLLHEFSLDPASDPFWSASTTVVPERTTPSWRPPHELSDRTSRRRAKSDGGGLATSEGKWVRRTLPRTSRVARRPQYALHFSKRRLDLNGTVRPRRPRLHLLMVVLDDPRILQ